MNKARSLVDMADLVAHAAFRNVFYAHRPDSGKNDLPTLGARVKSKSGLPA